MITTGSCKYQIDLVDYDVKEGDILFIPPLFLHSITDECNEKMVSDTYVFHLNFLGGKFHGYLFNTISHTDDEPGIFYATPDYA